MPGRSLRTATSSPGTRRPMPTAPRRRCGPAATNCQEPDDTAGYWTPTLYSHGVEIRPDRLHAYYRWGQFKDVASIQPVPAGLKIIAGDAKAIRPQSSSIVGWNCGVQGQTQYDHPISCSSGQKIVLHLFFPNCWNGRDLDSPDHKSHMAYSHNGTCPPGFPVAIARLSADFGYPITDGSAITLSSGSSWTAHTDFWNTWKTRRDGEAHSTIASTVASNAVRSITPCSARSLVEAVDRGDGHARLPAPAGAARTPTTGRPGQRHGVDPRPPASLVRAGGRLRVPDPDPRGVPVRPRGQSAPAGRQRRQLPLGRRVPAARGGRRPNGPRCCPTASSTAGAGGWSSRRSVSSESMPTSTSSSPSSTGRSPAGARGDGWTPTPSCERPSGGSWCEPCSASSWVTSPTRSANGWNRPCATCNGHRCRGSTSTCGGTATAERGPRRVRSTS